MKNFDKWNRERKSIETSKGIIFYHTREIWWCSLGINVGFEEDGTGKNFDRPVLILRGISRNTCIVVPLTTSKEQHKMRIDVGLVNGKVAKALISQIKVIDTKRLIRKVGSLNERF